MNKTAKIIITVLSILLVASVALNVLCLIGNGAENETATNDKTVITEKPSSNEIEEDAKAIEKDSTNNEQR